MASDSGNFSKSNLIITNITEASICFWYIREIIIAVFKRHHFGLKHVKNWPFNCVISEFDCTWFLQYLHQSPDDNSYSRKCCHAPNIGVWLFIILYVRVLTNNFFRRCSVFFSPSHTCQSLIHILIPMSPIDSLQSLRWLGFDLERANDNFNPILCLLLVYPTLFFAYVF